MSQNIAIFPILSLHPCTRFILEDLLAVGSPMLSLYQHQQEQSMPESHAIIGSIHLTEEPWHFENLAKRFGSAREGLETPSTGAAPIVNHRFTLTLRRSRYWLLHTVAYLTLDFTEGSEPHTPQNKQKEDLHYSKLKLGRQRDCSSCN